MSPCIQILLYWCMRCTHYYGFPRCKILTLGMQLQFNADLPQEWYADCHGLYRCRDYFRK